MMTSEMLEATLVQRGRLAERVVDKVRESTTTKSKHHALLIGPRGIGKTHLVSVAYHRIRSDSDLSERLAIAWLQEEEWGVASYLDFLLSLLGVLARDYRSPQLSERIETLYGRSPEEATAAAESYLLDFIGSRTLLVIAENLDEIFRGLETEGQHKLPRWCKTTPYSHS